MSFAAAFERIKTDDYPRIVGSFSGLPRQGINMAQTSGLFRSVVNRLKANCGSERKTICVYWLECKNWGDALNPVLIELLSGKAPVLVSENYLNIRQRPIYAAIGSIFQNLSPALIKKTSIWGSGFISEASKLAGTPKQIHAVRGPLTREKIMAQGIRCPEIYGDPALLYPRYYRPEKNSRYLLGIIPHYIDKNDEVIKRFEAEPGVKIIDIEGTTNEVVDEICSCKYVASSSLHGIIAADAYGIPSAWIEISKKVIGNGFKFRDYFASVERLDTEPIKITEFTTVDDILGQFYRYKISIDLDMLLESCPFYVSHL